jgi:hypothetical protein
MSELKQSEPSYYAIVPAPIRYADINNGAKLLYAEITALSNKHGFCWASNAYFAKLYGTNKSTIKRWLRELAQHGFISSATIRDDSQKVIQRKLCITQTPGVKNEPTPGVKNEPTPGVKNEPTPGVKNEPENNTSKNNTSKNINNLSLTPSSGKLSTDSSDKTKQPKREIKDKPKKPKHKQPMPLTQKQADTVKQVRGLFAQWGFTISENENGMLVRFAQKYPPSLVIKNAQTALGLADTYTFGYFVKMMQNEDKME